MGFAVVPSHEPDPSDFDPIETFTTHEDATQRAIVKNLQASLHPEEGRSYVVIEDPVLKAE